MKNSLFILCAGLLLGSTTAHAQMGPASGDLFLTGDKKLACEAILCLSSSKRPHECNSALRRYFSIKFKRKPWKTIRERKNFLKLCPASNDSAQMVSLVDALAEAGESCEVENLNEDLKFVGCVTRARAVEISDGDSGSSTHYHYYCERTVERSDQLPNVCKTYFNHEFTDFGHYDNTPVFVGKSGEGGFWTTWANKDQAEKQYAQEQARRARIEAETNSFCSRSWGKHHFNRCHWPENSYGTDSYDSSYN